MARRTRTRVWMVKELAYFSLVIASLMCAHFLVRLLF